MYQFRHQLSVVIKLVPEVVSIGCCCKSKYAFEYKLCASEIDYFRTMILESIKPRILLPLVRNI